MRIISAVILVLLIAGFAQATGVSSTAALTAATATALAANGANCSAGNAPLGVDASGAAEGCFDVEEEGVTCTGCISDSDVDLTDGFAWTGTHSFTDSTLFGGTDSEGWDGFSRILVEKAVTTAPSGYANIVSIVDLSPAADELNGYANALYAKVNFHGPEDFNRSVVINAYTTNNAAAGTLNEQITADYGAIMTSTGTHLVNTLSSARYVAEVNGGHALEAYGAIFQSGGTGATAHVESNYGLEVLSPLDSGGPTIDENCGICVDDQEGAAPDDLTWALKTGSGKVEFKEYRVIGAVVGPTVVAQGEPSRARAIVTIPFAIVNAADVTQDFTIGTLPARGRLVAIYADVTQAFVCAGTCTTATLSMTVGSSAGGNNFIVSSDIDAAAAVFGDADAELGTGINRASAIQGAFIGSWSTTTPISVRLTSGTGNFGDGATSNLNAGSITFYIITELL